jgi:penicillin V acylase-like amidase (Ntn superfamily)
MKEKRICPISNLPLPPESHGNKKYHPDAETEAKYRNNERRYTRIRNLTNLAIRLDDILAKYFPNSNGTDAISKEVLKREGFRWDFNSTITELADNIPVFWVLDYGYSFGDKKGESIIIYYGNNPLQ